jgi:tripartite-type tricarboxylate transporter receptor subunit TctC
MSNFNFNFKFASSLTSRRNAIRQLAVGASWISMPVLAAKPAASSGGTDWPNKPVKIVVPFGKGSSTDFMARLVAQRLTENLDAEFLVENKPGAGGVYGSVYVSKAMNDGYTILVTPTSHAVQPALYSNLVFDPIKDFEPVMKMATSPVMIAARADFPAQTAKEFFELAKKISGNPLMYGTEGTGTVFHMIAEGLKRNPGLKLKHSPYRSGAEAIAAAIAGDIPLVIDTPKNLKYYIDSKKLKPLLVMSKQRSAAFPDTYTISELGLPNAVAYNHYKVLLPAQTAPQIISKLNAELVKILTEPEMKAKLASKGTTVNASSPSELQVHVEKEIRRWKQDTASYNMKT